MGIIELIVGAVMEFAIGFGVISIVTNFICAAFGFNFSWSIVFGIWLIIVLIRYAINSSNVN